MQIFNLQYGQIKMSYNNTHLRLTYNCCRFKYDCSTNHVLQNQTRRQYSYPKIRILKSLRVIPILRYKQYVFINTKCSDKNKI